MSTLQPNQPQVEAKGTEAATEAATGTTSMEPPATVAAPPALKPPSETSDTITLRVRVKDQAGVVIFFKVKPTTKMRKVFEAYAQRKGVQFSSLRFLLDGERITDEDTPKTLELEDSDQIDCLLEQYGGSGLTIRTPPSGSAEELRKSLVEAHKEIKALENRYTRENEVFFAEMTKVQKERKEKAKEIKALCDQLAEQTGQASKQRKEIKALHIQNQTAQVKIKHLEMLLRKKDEASSVAAPPTMKVPIDKQVWLKYLDALEDDFSQAREEDKYEDTQQGLLQRGIDLGYVDVWRVPKHLEGKDYKPEKACIGPVKDMTKVENNELMCLCYNKQRILSSPLISKFMNDKQREEMFENMTSLLDITKDRTWLSEELGEELKRHAERKRHERKRHERKRKAEAPPAHHAAKNRFCPSTKGVAMAKVQDFCDTLEMEDTNELGDCLEEDEGVLQAVEASGLKDTRI